MYEYWRVSSKLSPGANIINNHTRQASALNAQLVQTLGWYDPYQKTHTRSKEAKSQNKNGPNGPQVLIFINKHSTGASKGSHQKYCKHMKHQMKWHTKTTKYEWYPNTTLQIAATKSLRLASGQMRNSTEWGKKPSNCSPHKGVTSVYQSAKITIYGDQDKEPSKWEIAKRTSSIRVGTGSNSYLGVQF